MAVFVSPSRNLKIWDEKLVRGNDGIERNVGKKIAEFAPLGRFVTEDTELIEKLKANPSYGVGKGKFIMIDTVPKPKGNVIQGVRSAGTAVVFDKQEKLIRLGELRARLLKKDGSFRKDASDEDINELKSIQEELGV